MCADKLFAFFILSLLTMLPTRCQSPPPKRPQCPTPTMPYAQTLYRDIALHALSGNVPHTPPGLYCNIESRLSPSTPSNLHNPPMCLSLHLLIVILLQLADKRQHLRQQAQPLLAQSIVSACSHFTARAAPPPTQSASSSGSRCSAPCDGRPSPPQPPARRPQAPAPTREAARRRARLRRQCRARRSKCEAIAEVVLVMLEALNQGS